LRNGCGLRTVDWTHSFLGGDKGLDVAPEPDGSAESPYYETLEFTPCGTVENADSQELSVVRYQQIVTRKSDGKVSHDQTGYWMWDPATGIVMQSLTIPRAVTGLVGLLFELLWPSAQ